MSEETSIEVASLRPQGLIRLRTVTRLRWFAVVGQALVTGFVVMGLNYDAPVFALFLTIAVAVIVNIYFSLRHSQTEVLSGNALLGHLVFDVLQIGAMLFLTGGIHNPFVVWLILAPMLAAFALDVKRAGIVMGVVTVILTLGALWHYPLPGEFDAPSTYTVGTLVALMLGVAFTAAYARQVSIANSKLSAALEATQAVLAREEKLTAVGGLAAAAAHELGTPLGTILVTAKEMQSELPAGHLREDTDLLISQTQRCQRILTRLANLGYVEDQRHAELTLDGMLHEASKPFLDQPGLDIEFHFDPDSCPSAPERLKRIPAVIYGLRTLIENAVKFADRKMRISASWDARTLQVVIEDDGPGFPAHILSRLGEPFARQDRAGSTNGRHGLGLGFFIAKTLLERTGATMNFGNGRYLSGAWVEISWPLSRLLIEDQKHIMKSDTERHER